MPKFLRSVRGPSRTLFLLFPKQNSRNRSRNAKFHLGETTQGFVFRIVMNFGKTRTFPSTFSDCEHLAG
jgi:hypothetical protein